MLSSMICERKPFAPISVGVDTLTMNSPSFPVIDCAAVRAITARAVDAMRSSRDTLDLGAHYTWIDDIIGPVSYTHLTLPTTPYV